MAAVAVAACDHGFEPPNEPTTGTIVADIQYVGHPDAWPPESELRELLFIAMRFVPRDTSDFLQLNRIVFSDRLAFRVAGERVVLSDVPTGPYPYAGVAQKFGGDPFDWRPVGLVEDDGGMFVVTARETTFVTVEVDFVHPPDFPPDVP